MYSPSSSSSDSISSSGSYDDRRRRRRPHRSKSKSRKALHSMFEDETSPRYQKELSSKKLSPLLMKRGVQLSDEKPRSYRREGSSRRDDSSRREDSSRYEDSSKREDSSRYEDSSKRGDSSREKELVSLRMDESASSKKLKSLRSLRKDDSPREKEPKFRKKLSHRDKEAGVSKEELAEIKREHEKELKNLLKFLEKESSLVNGIEEEKREEMYELKRQHEKEVKKLFEVQEKELSDVKEDRDRKQEELEEKIETTQKEAYEELRRYKEQVLALEEDLETTVQELQSTTQKTNYETRKLRDQLSIEARQTSLLENEVRSLREKLAEKDALVGRYEGANAKSTYVEKELRGEIRIRDEELQHKDRVIKHKNEEIRSLTSQLEGFEWEETSGLTTISDLDLRKDHREHHFREKPPHMKYDGFSSPDKDRGRHSASKRRDRESRDRESRNDLEASRLTVSFSDDVEKRHLPMQAHDSLSRRLEKMYLPR